MYMTMSISTGLYPKLDLLTANKLITYLLTHNICCCTLCTSYPWYLLVHTTHIIPVTSAGAHYAHHTHDICWYILCTSYMWHLLVHTTHIIPMTSAGAHYAHHTCDIFWCTLCTSYLWHLLVHTTHVIPITHYAPHNHDIC